jgi:NarL family two-component system response regulator LiaR
MPDQIRVLLADPHSFVRQGLRSILEPDPQFVVVGEAATGELALRIVTDEHPDVVLLDRQLPDMSGLDLCRSILQLCPETAVLVLTTFKDRDLADACLRAGAQDCVLKDVETLDLKERCLAAMQGGPRPDPDSYSVPEEPGPPCPA